MRKVPTKGLGTQTLLALKRLGVLDHRNRPKEEMLTACKALHIDIKDLGPKSYDEFLQR